jgi:hypothetical protein
MWTWNADPFGTDAANPNPSGAGPLDNCRVVLRSQLHRSSSSGPARACRMALRSSGGLPRISLSQRIADHPINHIDELLPSLERWFRSI